MNMKKIKINFQKKMLKVSEQKFVLVHPRAC